MLDDQNLEAAAQLASNMDVCLVFVGSDAGEGCGSTYLCLHYYVSLLKVSSQT